MISRRSATWFTFATLDLRRVKVALAWNSKVTTFFGLPLSSRLTVDLDLIVRDSGRRSSGRRSWDNSYEVVEFAGSWGETYEIVIRRWSGTDRIWYGIAWATTGLRFPVPIPVEDVLPPLASLS